MECVETAKNWCLKQGKPVPPLSPPTVVIIDDGDDDDDDDDDSLSGRPLTCGSGDEDFVEQLLNFNNDNTEQEDALGPDCVGNTEEDGKKHGAFASPAPMVAKQHQGDFVKEDFGSILAPLQVDEPHLEWLSQFVEDSFSTPYPATLFTSKTEHRPWAAKPGTTALVTTTKSKRTQRGRTSSMSWSFGSDSTTISSSSSTSSSHSNGIVLISSPMMLAKKKPRMMARAVLEGKARGTQVATPRRCSHCGVQKTPQWREGPGGAKSLCNACGVRFKKGRLLPEYRPACSPTFSSELHSNSHRKVMELRRKKEEMMKGGAGWTGGGEPGVARPVSGYL